MKKAKIMSIKRKKLYIRKIFLFYIYVMDTYIICKNFNKLIIYLMFIFIFSHFNIY